MPSPLDRIPLLYHFTDTRNLPLIRELGGLYSLSQLRALRVDIPAPGGNEWSHDADCMKGLDEYVHLCFRRNHPMEYVARQEGRIAESIFLQIDRGVLDIEGVRFTPDVSNKAGVESCSLEEACAIIDFDVLYTRAEWREPEVQQRLQLSIRDSLRNVAPTLSEDSLSEIAHSLADLWAHEASYMRLIGELLNPRAKVTIRRTLLKRFCRSIPTAMTALRTLNHRSVG
jgi:hypothetical protein